MTRAKEPTGKLAQVEKMYLGVIIPSIRRIYEGTGAAWESYILVHCALLSLSGFYAGSKDTGGGTYRKFVSDFFPSQYAGSDLWKDLRNGLIHANTLTAHYCLTFQHPEMHFYQMKSVKNERTGEPANLVFLNFENFLADFERATRTYFERVRADSELLNKLCRRYDVVPPPTYIPDKDVPSKSKLGTALNTRGSTTRRNAPGE